MCSPFVSSLLRSMRCGRARSRHRPSIRHSDCGIPIVAFRLPCLRGDRDIFRRSLTRNALVNSERKIDQIEGRLEGIESLLRQLVSARSASSVESTTHPNPTAQYGQIHGTETLRVTPSGIDRTPSSASSHGNRGVSASDKGGDGDNSSTLFDPEDTETFEGNSSLAAHTAFASEFRK